MLKTYIVDTIKNCLGEAVLRSTHNACFESKIRKFGIPLQAPVLLYKSGVQGGIHFTDIQATCAISNSVVSKTALMSN